MARYLLRFWAEHGKVLSRTVECDSAADAIRNAQQRVGIYRRVEVWHADRLLAEIDLFGTVKLLVETHDAGEGIPAGAQRKTLP